MANKKITDLPSASALTGAELLEGVQGGINVKLTTQDVADLSTGVEHYRGDFAGGTAFPNTGGTGASNVPAMGDKWRLTGTLTVSGNLYAAGTVIEAAIDTPGNTRANWNIYAMQL
jgi:hypothetical protein